MIGKHEKIILTVIDPLATQLWKHLDKLGVDTKGKPDRFVGATPRLIVTDLNPRYVIMCAMFNAFACASFPDDPVNGRKLFEALVTTMDKMLKPLEKNYESEKDPQ